MNEESKTLLEKLEIIKTAKDNIYNTLILIGASDYVNESTPFIEYSNAIMSTFSKLLDSCALLEYILYGAANMDSIKSKNLTYPNLAGYLADLSNLRITLIDNLNIKGIQCSDNDTLEQLVNKVLEINNN